MDQLAEVAALKAAIQTAIIGTEPDRYDDVRAAVRDLVTVLKPAGWPVEAIIVLIKKTAIEGGLPANHPFLPDASQTAVEQVLDNAVRICIQHYYKEE